MSDLIEVDQDLLTREVELQRRSDEIEKMAQKAMKMMQDSLNETRETLTSSDEISSAVAAAVEQQEEETNIELMVQAVEDLKNEESKSNKTSAVSSTAIKLLQAKLRTTSDQLKLAIERARKSEIEAGSLEGKVKALTEENIKINKQNQSLLQTADRNKIALAEAYSSKQELQSRIHALEKQLEQSSKNLKKSQTAQSSIEVKLNRALEELQKSKDQLYQLSSTNIASSQGSSISLKDGSSSKASNLSLSDTQKLRDELKQSEKQKQNLALLIKKQAQLVDVLKRQKIHLEAAKVLQITEEDFVKCLDSTK